MVSSDSSCHNDPLFDGRSTTDPLRCHHLDHLRSGSFSPGSPTLMVTGVVDIVSILAGVRVV